MQNGNGFLGVLFLTAAIGISSLTGCSDKARSSGEKLLAAATAAQKQCLKALATLGNPYFRDAKTGKLSPLPVQELPNMKAPDAELDRIQLVSANDVNSETLAILAQAQQSLEAALAENADATAADKAVATAVLANILRAQGEYYSATFIRDAAKADQTLEVIRQASRQAQAQTVMVQFYDTLLKSTPKEMEEAQARLAEDKQKLDASVKELDEKIAQSTTQRDALALEAEKANGESTSLMTESSSASDGSAVRKFERAVHLRQEATEKLLKVQAIEAEMEVWKAIKAGHQGALEILSAKADAAAKAIADRNQMLASAGEFHQAAEAAAKATTDQLKAALNQLNKSGDLKNAQAAADQGVAAYAKANKKFAEAGRLGSRDSQLSAQQGGASMDGGNLSLQYRAFAMHAQEVFKALPEGAAPDVKLPDPDALLKNAVASFKSATVEFHQALTANRANDIRWIYQASEGAAWLALANASEADRAEASKNAVELLAQARERKENSPYLKEVNKLSDMAQPKQ